MTTQTSELPQLTLLDENNLPTESELYSMTSDHRLRILSELRTYVLARQAHEIPDAIAQFGVLISRKLRASAELGVRKKKTKAAAPEVAKASDAELF